MPGLIQPSLTGGELAPSFHGRVDLELYHSSLKTCLNFIPRAFGGAYNRPGSRYVAGCYSNTRYSRLVPFSFSAEQNYVLEFCGGIAPQAGSILKNGGDGYMRVYSRGKQQVYSATGTDRAGNSHTKDDPVTLGIPWYMADLRDLKFSQSGDVLTVTHPNYQPCEILRYGNDDWAIRKMPFHWGPFQPINSNKGTTVAASAVNGRVTVGVSSGDPIFSDGRVGQLFLIQQRGYGIPWEVGKQVTAGDIRRSDGKYYLAKNTGKTGSLRPSHTADEWWDGGDGGGAAGNEPGGVKWEFLHPGFGVGEIVSVASDGLTATVEVLNRYPDAACDASLLSATTGTTITAIASGPIDGSLTFNWTKVTAPSHGLTGDFGEIMIAMTIKFNTTSNELVTLSWDALTAIVVNATTLNVELPWDTFTSRNYVSLSAGSGLRALGTGGGTTPNKEATYKWAFGAWGGDQGWPTASTYFQQRHCFAGTPTQPQTVWTSRTGDYSDFGTSNPIEDDDALTWTVASAQIDGIKSLLPLKRLIMFTLGGNWSSPDGTLTPANLAADMQNYYGSSSLVPLGIGNTALYYGKSGTIRDMSFSFADDGYVGNDLTIRGNHLMKDHSILEWDFQQSPFPIIWSVREDGVLLALTYLREEKVIGWSRHTFSGNVESVCVINECGEDHVYMVVKRTIGGATKRYVECMYGRVDDLYEACFVDSALSYDGRNITAGATISATGTYTAGGTVTLAATNCTPFVTGSPSTDIGDQIVLEATDGTRTRITITAVASTTSATGTLVTALPASLQAVATDSWAFARDTFTGLGHLEGQAVSVYADGETYSATVSSGSVSLTGHPGYVVTVGLPIVADLEPLPVVAPGQQGPLIEKVKLIKRVNIVVENSRSCYLGPDSSNLLKSTLRVVGDDATAVSLGSGILECMTLASWSRNGSFLLRHTEATPLSILALIPDTQVGG